MATVASNIPSKAMALIRLAAQSSRQIWNLLFASNPAPRSVDSIPILYENANDNTLVELHLSGDPEAFNILIKRYSPRIYNLVYRYLLISAEAENLTQETFLRVYKALPESKRDLPFSPWIFRIATNLCRDWWRARHTVPFTELEPEDSDESAVEAVPDNEISVQETLEQAELQEALRKAVLLLPEKYRIPITLYYNEQLSYEQIAKVMDLPVNTIRTHLARAKTRLRHELRGFVDI